VSGTCARHPGSSVTGACDRCGDFVCATCGTSCPACRERASVLRYDPQAKARNAARAFLVTLPFGVLGNVLPPWMFLGTAAFGFQKDGLSAITIGAIGLCLGFAVAGVGAQAALVVLADHRLRREEVSFAAALTRAFVRLPALVVTTGARFLIVFAMILSAVLTRGQPFAPAAILVTFCGLGWLLLRLSLASVVAILEEPGGRAALVRSFELTKGRALLVAAFHAQSWSYVAVLVGLAAGLTLLVPRAIELQMLAVMVLYASLTHVHSVSNVSMYRAWATESR
jgi:hypothetical protein